MNEPKIVITGDFYAGKTTFSRYLESQGWTFIDHTGLLKTLGYTALQAAGAEIPASDLSTHKDKYRRFLEELGVLINWDEGFGVREALRRWRADGARTPVVLDTVRTIPQWLILEEEGFRLVRLVVPMEVRRRRAAAQGVSSERLIEIQSYLNQSLLPPQEGEIILHGARAYNSGPEVTYEELSPADLLDELNRSLGVTVPTLEAL